MQVQTLWTTQEEDSITFNANGSGFHDISTHKRSDLAYHGGLCKSLGD